MKYLVFCECGHSMERHGKDGCAGSQAASDADCACRNSEAEALEAAILEARQNPWGGGSIVSA